MHKLLNFVSRVFARLRVLARKEPGSLHINHSAPGKTPSWCNNPLSGSPLPRSLILPDDMQIRRKPAVVFTARPGYCDFSAKPYAVPLKIARL